MPGPLTGVKVIDVTTTFLGPYCTFLMAQMGAEVIKVESPQGDITRSLGGRDDPRNARSFLLNRGKRSIVLDLKREGSRQVMAKLVAGCDVFIHNMRPAAAERLGLSHDEVSEWNPSVVYCAGYGYGSDGPYTDQPAYDDIIQAASGLAFIQSDDKGVPRFMNTIIADKTCGITALYAILAALLDRERTGQGQAVDIAMFETMVAYTLAEHMGGMGVEPPLGPPGYSRVVSPYRRPYETTDGYIAVMVYTDRHWKSFCDIIGREDLRDDPVLSLANNRILQIDKVYELVADFAKCKATEEALALLKVADVPSVRVNTLADLFEDPHLKAVGFFELNSDGRGDPIRNMKPAAQFSRSRSEPMPAGPGLGEHSTEVLREVGYSEEAVRELVEKGIVRTGLVGGAESTPIRTGSPGA